MVINKIDRFYIISTLLFSGMLTPTSGTATVAGYDIITEINGVRKSLGLCPQHNILYDELTVAEHIYFYSKLKGLMKKEIDIEIEKYVAMLELIPKVLKYKKFL